MEKIIRIEETTFKNEKNSWFSYDGFVITTDKQKIKLGIDNEQGCCEDWGFFMSEDELDEFIGAEVISIEVVDTCLNKKKIDDLDMYEGDTVFVNIETSKGTLQFTAYNEHNGYYGHDVVVLSEQLNLNTTI